MPETTTAAHPSPLGSLVASARRLTSADLNNRTFKGTGKKGWQEDAWEMYDLVGEQRFLTNTLSNRMAQARIFVGVRPDDPTENPEPTDNDEINAVLDSIGDGPVGLAQIIARTGANLMIAGDGWIVGIPSYLMPRSQGGDPDKAPSEPSIDGLSSLDDLQWRMLSVSEVEFTQIGGHNVTLILGETKEERVETDADSIWLIRVWRPHPRRAWEADSPTRSSLPVLRELVGLTMHIGAQVDSRLAGAGLLIVPQSAARALRIAAGIPEDSPDDPFTEALMEAMLTPINDRANASALVPLVVTVPDEATGAFNYLTFSKPLDTEARSLRDEAIRRLALGQDAPPELLLGTSGMNHWGAWLVQEDVVTTHLEPPLALVCDALTTQFLWPVLIDSLGMDEEEAHGFVVWYDVSEMIIRPNRSADALQLFDRGVISDATVRDSAGFGDADAPEPPGEGDIEEQALELTLELVRAAPGLVSDPGLPAVMAQFRELLGGEPAPVPEPVPQPPQLVPPAPSTEEPAPTEEPPPAEGAPPANEPTGGPEQETAPPPPPAIAAAASPFPLPVPKHGPHPVPAR